MFLYELLGVRLPLGSELFREGSTVVTVGLLLFCRMELIALEIVGVCEPLLFLLLCGSAWLEDVGSVSFGAFGLSPRS